MTSTDAIDPELLRPRYTLGGASTILGISPATMHAWTRQRTYRGADGSQRGSVALVTTVDAVDELTVPFLGLAEAYVLATFSAAGLSLVHLRPALSFLARELAPVSPLTSETLVTRGPEVLHRYEDPTVFAALLAAADPPRFREPVERLLAGITYRDGRASAIRLPGRSPAVVLDPRRDAGRPTLARSGVGVTDVISRLAAGQPAEQVALETGADLDDVRLLRH
ncbi:hypothetical protein V2J52_00375 [Georgenia sp. MJ173]|uniref:hypothetical protein n=1 Tax=Georgenia sunbinii TaxID=3117728 RepID=UPI002F26D412